MNSKRKEEAFFAIFLVVIAACSIVDAQGPTRPRLPRFQLPNQYGVESNSSIPSYTLLQFEQKLDHFNFEDSTTWTQRYLITDEFLSPTNAVNPVIVFYSGNEGAIEVFWNNSGFAFTLAAHFNAFVIFAEHRYYGESLPFGEASLEPGNVGYLSVEQALADYAALITSIKSSNPNFTNSPVITLGGSYGGMLSAWFRMKYPNVVVGALAASAPIMQFVGSEFPKNPTDFLQIVTEDFEQAASNSSNRLREAVSKILELSETSEGMAQLQSIFKPCGEPNIAELLTWVEDGLAYLAMGDYPYPATFFTPMPGYPVNISAPIFNEGEDVLQALVNGLQIYYNYTGEAGACFNLTVFFAKGAIGINTWEYQTCTEIVIPLASNSSIDFMPTAAWNFTQVKEYCEATWGVTPDENWATTFGYNTLNGATNIIFSNGILDPWRGGGVLETYDPSLPALLVEGGAHHLDIRGPNPLDPQSVIEVREKEIAFFESWISDYYAGLEEQQL